MHKLMNVLNAWGMITLRHEERKISMEEVGMLISVFGQTDYRFRKNGFESIIGFTDRHKILYYVKQITLCITRCNLRTHNGK